MNVPLIYFRFHSTTRISGKQTFSLTPDFPSYDKKGLHAEYKQK